jgi:polyribonucleotide nucleotidyltransferase
MKIVSKKIEIGDKELSLEVGRFAGQANAAVLGRYGDTMVLATVVSSSPREDLDYLPLFVEYMERLYAGGRIKGSRWVKREGRPSDEATRTARLIDRSIRPLFPEEYRNEVQVIITVLSVDSENDPDIPAICAASAALAISDIPWKGPVGAVRIGFVPRNGEETFIVNPTYQDLEYSEIDLVISGTQEAVVMIEGGAKSVSEETILKGLNFAHKEAAKVIQLIKELQKTVGQKKKATKEEKLDVVLAKKIEKEIGKDLEKLITSLATKEESGESLEELMTALAEKYDEEKKADIAKIVDELIKKKIRTAILEKGKRPDGRKPEEIRPLLIEAGILPRTHGSAMFARGNTQVLTVTTLGSPSLEQLIEGMTGEETKRYIHHYYMPPFSLGETGRLGWPSRREVGHGALAEKALEPMIPAEEKFPYTIRLVSEIMSSNGSTSMAAVSGSTLSLMDAGVPIKAPVAGIAMGLVLEKGKVVILSDILGMEDFHGDMDFKIAGTREGITALQMDVKSRQLTLEILKKAMIQAREGRTYILDEMLKVLPASRAQISKFAPKVSILHIPVEKIGEVIGPGGRVIREIIEKTGAAVDVEDDGTVNISGADRKSVDQAIAWIEGLTREVEVGETFEGTVKRIQPFGAFVEIAPGKEGLVHVSQMSTKYVADPNDVLSVDQKVKVRVREVDDMGRINLSMLFGEDAKRAPRPRQRRPSKTPSRRPPPRRRFSR